MNRRETQSAGRGASMRDPEFDALTDGEIFEEAKDRLSMCMDAEMDNRNHAKSAMRFREGDQWDDSPATSQSMDQPELVINLTDSFVTRVENNIRQQRPRGKAHPVGDGADTELADVMNGIGRHVEARSEAGVAYDQAAKHAITGGWGYFRLIAEYLNEKSFQKDLRILPIRNVFTVFMDPSALMPSACDAEWCLISVKIKLTEYRRKYGDEPATDWNDMSRDQRVRDWQDKEEIRLAEYFRIRQTLETLYLIKTPEGEEYTRFKSEMISKESLAAMGHTVIDKRESTRKKVEWFRLNGLKVVAREQLPGTYIPVFRVEGNATDLDGEMLRRGMVKSMTDPQRMVNYGEVAKIKRLGLTPKAPWIAAEGQIDGHPEWVDSNTQAYSVLTYKPVVMETSQGSMMVPPPQRQNPAQIEAGFAEFVQGMRTNLLAVSGMPHEPGQDMQSQVVSGTAIKQRGKMSDQSHFQYYDNLTLAIAQLWRVMLEYIPHYFNEPGRIQRIIGDDSTPKMITLNKEQQDGAITRIENDLSVGTYDVVMDTGPGYESRREEGAETLMQLVNNSALGHKIAEVGPDLVLRSIDHPYMQELADRFVSQTPDGLKKIVDQLPERARAIVQSLGSKVQQLEHQLQSVQADLKYGITKAHLAATTKAHDTETNAETRRFDTIVRAHSALADTEIKVAGKILDSHVQAGHAAQTREAEHFIDIAEQAERQSSAIAPNSPNSPQPNGAQQ